MITQQKVLADSRTVAAIGPQLRDTERDMQAFNSDAGWHKRGFFDAQETREAELLLNRFVTKHTALWDLINSYDSLEAEFDDTLLQKKAHLVAATASLMLARHSASLVLAFAGDDIAIEQMNQAYYRSNISYGTYDRTRSSITDRDKQQILHNSDVLYTGELTNTVLEADQFGSSNPQFAVLIEQFPALLEQTRKSIDAVEKVYPSHFLSEVAQVTSDISQHKVLYELRSIIFKDVSRLKSPNAQIIRFSEEQKAQIYSLLEPGDLILTYTAGYMSSVFIPGAFKHGITYIGSPQQRQSMALSPKVLPEDETFDRDALARNLAKNHLPDGKQADVIEAVAEGVIFNNIGHIMNTHINRMLVLRPRLSATEGDEFLVGIYSYLGDGYDFRFDFSDSTYQVCTEVIWREIDGKGGINFELTERAGNPTLSADDIVNYHLGAGVGAATFDFIFYAEEDAAGTDHAAIVLTESEGKARLGKLMQSMKESMGDEPTTN